MAGIGKPAAPTLSKAQRRERRRRQTRHTRAFRRQLRQLLAPLPRPARALVDTPGPRLRHGPGLAGQPAAPRGTAKDSRVPMPEFKLRFAS